MNSNIKLVNMENYPRIKHFNHFIKMDYPFFSITGNLDVTNLYKYVKANKLSFFRTVLYLIMKSLNSIKEFRYRIQKDKKGNFCIVEHEIIHPSFTTLVNDDIFSFCAVDFSDDYMTFMKNIEFGIEKVKKDAKIENEENPENRVFITSIPWISFTNITHPISMNPENSNPIISIGKYFSQNEKLLLPLSVQAHHALVDGIHVGRLFEVLQCEFDGLK